MELYRILLIEDNPAIGQSLLDGFKHHDFHQMHQPLIMVMAQHEELDKALLLIKGIAAKSYFYDIPSEIIHYTKLAIKNVVRK
jgi:hypothetical protein